MNKSIHKILFKLLPLRWYLRVVSRMLFMLQRMGWGKHNAAVEYIYHLPELISTGGVAIDIGANLGYYTRPLSKIVGREGKVYAVEPVPPIFDALTDNTLKLRNVTLMNVALGEENKTITMANDTIAKQGYFGTGQNFVKNTQQGKAIEFTALMQRGSELFTSLERLDLIKCDIEGYESVVIPEMLPIIERHRPNVLLESGGENREKMIMLFTNLNYSCATLVEGVEVAFDPATDNGKDLIFRPN